MKRDKILEKISRACDGLVYISERDAPITAFLSEPANVETIDSNLTHVTSVPNDGPEEMDFELFFARLSVEKDWHGAKEKERVQKFRVLKSTLEDNLSELKVFKFGRVRKEIFVVGRDKDDRLMGVRTESVET